MPSGARTRAFRDLPEPGCHVVPAVYDALSARVAGRGLAVAPSGWGACGPPPAGSPPPDVGQLTRTPMADHLRRMTDAVSISRSWPTVDTGDGNPLSVRRPVQVYEAAGAQAIVLEDEEWPQKCGPVSGRAPGDPDVPPPATKLAARCDSRTVGIARTDARGCLGLEEVLRARRGPRSAWASTAASGRPSRPKPSSRPLPGPFPASP